MWVSPPSSLPPLLKGALTKATSSMSDKTEGKGKNREGRCHLPNSRPFLFGRQLVRFSNIFFLGGGGESSIDPQIQSLSLSLCLDGFFGRLGWDDHHHLGAQKANHPRSSDYGSDGFSGTRIRQIYSSSKFVLQYTLCIQYFPQ